MPTPVWQPGHLYLPGDLVQPITAPTPESAAITNPGFEGGSTDWTLDTGVSVSTSKKFSGTSSVQFSGTSGAKRAIHDSVLVSPGTSITASCMYAQGAASAGQNPGGVFLRWLDNSDVQVGDDALGTVITGGDWQRSTVTAVAPAGAAKVQIGAVSNRTASDSSYADDFTWNYVTQSLPVGLIYKAVQTDPGHSANDEPDWPPTLGLTVVDNEVTWEAVATSRVTWTAEPLLTSGSSEPTWPTTPGDFVSDGTIKWECISRRVEDENCPNSRVVLIIDETGKVYAGDGDITRFSATNNPLDWSSEADAGFIPTGLSSGNDVAVLSQYRANLAPFNAEGFQLWQVDPDPSAMAKLDQMPGIGSTWHRAAVPVGDELFFLAALGVRSVGIAAGSQNLAAGDIGMPIDVMVQDAIRVATANSSRVIGTYYPAAGQYWLAIANYPPPELSISGSMPDGMVGDAGSYAYTSAGGVLPHTFEIVSGSLPPQTTVDETGEAIYDYGLAGTYAFTVRVTDALGNTAELEDSVTVSALPMILSGSVTSTQYIIASPDGLDWNSAPIASGGAANNASYITGLPGRYFGRAIGAEAPGAYTTDAVGNSWTNTGANVISGAFGDAFTNGTLFIPSHIGNAFKSTNFGVTFSDMGKALGRFVALNRSEGKLAAVDASSIVESTDTGSTWTSGVSFSGVMNFNTGGCQGTDGVAYYYGGSQSSAPKLVRVIGGALTTVALPAMSGSTTALSFCYASGITTKVVGTDNGRIAYDNGDGAGFRLATTQLPNRVHQILWNGSVFVAISDPAGAGNGAIYTSPDGDVWTQATISTPRKWYSLAAAMGV